MLDAPGSEDKMVEKTELSTTADNSMKIDMLSTSNLLETKEAKESTGSSTQPAIKYPSGITLALVVMALMLAMFLIDLDMVSFHLLYQR
jgi:hypothetical protein